MSDRIEEMPFDDRHDTPPPWIPVADGEHIGNDHQESFFRPAYNDAGEQIGVEINHPHAQRPEFPGMPSRVPGQGLLNPPPPMPAFGTGLNWLASVQSPVRADLVNFDFGAAQPYENAPVVSNIELRTIYAHLLETAGRVRAEMRERGMQVDL